MQHVMLDLETLDTTPSALVLSIGAVRFDLSTSEIGDTFYAVLDLQSQVERGRTKSESTMAWWAGQSNEARSVLTAPKEDTAAVLSDFAGFLAYGCEGLWGNGSDFDNVIVADLYRSFDLRQPWSFSKNRCFRTVNALPKPYVFLAPLRRGTHHNALDDAIYQAQCLIAINKAKRLWP